MSGIVAQGIIRNLLESSYGDSPELWFLMRPNNRFAQYLIARKLLEKYDIIGEQLAQALPSLLRERCRNRRDLYLAIKLDIEDELNVYSDEAIQNKLREIIAQGPNPRGYPNFIRDLFEVDE